MPSTDFVPLDPRFLKACDAVMHALAAKIQTGTAQDISANIALKAALDAYGISSEFWHTGGGCTARYVVFGPGWEMSEHQLYIAITDDASVDHPIADHSGWLAMWYGPEHDGYADNELYNNEYSLENPTLADVAHDSACCARAIRDWLDGAATQWLHNDVSLEGITGPYRCQTRSERWKATAPALHPCRDAADLRRHAGSAPCRRLGRTSPLRSQRHGDRDAARPGQGPARRRRLLPNRGVLLALD
ncbi:hypothetical protein ACIHJG_35945 [Streptomyces sp. NPDC052415]|uniref:hypothetical protein n=1 Tax=Streptomyces sp. NPDC052415 TaxID=3365690 RepID=UPI0037D55B02